LIFAILIFLYPACGIVYSTSDLANSQYVITLYQLTLLAFILSMASERIWLQIAASIGVTI
jgi:hypothetical protein